MKILAKLMLLFTLVPLLDLMLLLLLSQHIGLQLTVGLVLTTALTGALLGKLQGLSAWRRIKADLASGAMPGDSLLDGLAVLMASVLLVTPGTITDITGFLLLIPYTRAPLRRFARRRFEKWLAKDDVGLFGGGGAMRFGVFGDDLMGQGMGYDTSHEPEGVINITPPGADKRQEERPEVITIGASR